MRSRQERIPGGVLVRLSSPGRISGQTGFVPPDEPTTAARWGSPEVSENAMTVIQSEYELFDLLAHELDAT